MSKTITTFKCNRCPSHITITGANPKEQAIIAGWIFNIDTLCPHCVYELQGHFDNLDEVMTYSEDSITLGTDRYIEESK